MTDRELLEQALEALWEANTILVCSNDAYKDSDIREKNTTIRQAIRARLAEDDEEPVGYITYIEDAGILFTQDEPEHGVYEPVYARPQPRARLTDEEIFDLENALPDEDMCSDRKWTLGLARAIEEKIWEKNS